MRISVRGIGELRIRAGTLRDYDVLGGYHYRCGRPATMSDVWCLVDEREDAVSRYLGRRGEGVIVGVLVVSYPALNCRLRDVAIGDYAKVKDKRLRAKKLNREMRTISRVVIRPEWRGLGLASKLVGYALEKSTTRYTEALAVMGRVHPFFEAGGMSRHDDGVEVGPVYFLYDKQAKGG